eukprot:6210656-Pleurochrysis_carterae.AAC.3
MRFWAPLVSSGWPQRQSLPLNSAKEKNIMTHWERYMTVFRNLHGRSPVVYDLLCRHGTFSRGAVLAGAQVIGFNIQDTPRTFEIRAVSRLGGVHHARNIRGLSFLSIDLLGAEPEPHADLLQATIRRLQSYQQERLKLDGVHVPSSVGNVQGAKPVFDKFGHRQIQLCGTMFAWTSSLPSSTIYAQQ